MAPANARGAVPSSAAQALRGTPRPYSSGFSLQIRFAAARSGMDGQGVASSFATGSAAI